MEIGITIFIIIMVVVFIFVMIALILTAKEIRRVSEKIDKHIYSDKGMCIKEEKEAHKK